MGSHVKGAAGDLKTDQARYVIGVIIYGNKP